MNETLSRPSIEAVDVRSCYLCGSAGECIHAGLRDSLFAAPGVWNLLSCPRCGLVWLSPRPRRKEIPRLYERYHTHTLSPAPEGARTGGLRRAVREAALRRACGYEIRPGTRGGVLPRFLADALGRLGPLRDVAAGSVLWVEASRRGRLLDVGCGSGGFLARMRDLGWEVQGVEPDPAAAETARSRFHLEVAGAPLEDAALPSEAFDVVTLSHVIEHVHDPVAFLAECRRLLRPGGTVVVVTPNSGSLGRRWFRDSWRGWEVPRHLFVFSTPTLRTCGERAGLQVDQVRTTARSARDILHDSRSLARRRGAAEPGDRQRCQALAFWLLEHVMAVTIPCGEELLMTARRAV